MYAKTQLAMGTYENFTVSLLFFPCLLYYTIRHLPVLA